MVDVVIQGAWVLYRINKDKGDKYLPFLAFLRHVVNVTFLKYSKESRFFASHTGIRNIPCINFTRCNLSTGIFKTLSNVLGEGGRRFWVNS